MKRELSLFYDMKQLNYLVLPTQKIKFICLGCSSSYFGKTERTLWERAEEHAYKNNNQKEQTSIYEHLLTCEYYNHIVYLFYVDNNSFNFNKLNLPNLPN